MITEGTGVEIEELQAELDEGCTDDSLFSISSWGADLSFREICAQYDENELVKPELQRKYVWEKIEASRFIESILLGLPVPSIFLAKSGSQKLIVDGYQRIMTVYDYMRGTFSADQKEFRLSNSPRIHRRWRNKLFSELSQDDQRRIRSTTIHAIIFEQKKPENNDASMYEIFERINTSGRTLLPQEIRNCVYQGSFNAMLFELNDNDIWRKLFGSATSDNRMRDMEYILRFFLIKTDGVLKNDGKQIVLKKSLNDFMSLHKNDSADDIARYKEEFLNTVSLVDENIGEKAFRSYSNGKFTNKFHPTIFEAIMIATFFASKKMGNLERVSEDRHIQLLENTGFREATTNRTTDTDRIRIRIRLAAEILYGVELDEF